ncbi:GDP-mannose 4,6-dehydratase [Candidatus Woesearchaeota archaeon]|nr:GDP-mannose 4,6-dehydratase [Candidatus Woesearchaeota archaeon]
MRCLITGITGFAGSHLAELLLKKGHEVFGTSRWRSKTENIDHIKSKIKLIEADMRDSHSMDKVIKEAKPDYIFHLAAQSFVQASWVSPADTMETNVIGTINLLEAVRRANISPVIQIACSSEEYGEVKQDEIPIKETHQLRPLSPYGVSKVAEDMLGYQYFKSYGLKIIRTRGFNHTGPRRGEVFVTSNFSKQIVEIEKGKKDPVIFVGNLTAVRDFTDVRDMVNAYLLAAEKGIPGEIYNICSGKGHKIQEVLDLLLSFSKIKIKVQQDPSRMRPSDVMILIGDNSKFVKQTGWEQTIEFEQTLKDLLDYWRERV